MNRLPFAVPLLLLVACGGRDAPIAPELQPPAGAGKLIHSKVEGFERVTYQIAEPFPPRALIERISSVAARNGWRPLSENAFNPSEKSAYVEGWRKRVVATGSDGPRRSAYFWWSQWRRENGAMLNVVLSYSWPRDGNPDLRTVNVESSIASAARLTEMGLGAQTVSYVPDGVGPQIDRVTEEPHPETR